MNSLDPSLAKYLSKSKQDIYEQYHGSSSSSGHRKKKKSKKQGYDEGGSTGTGLVIADDADDGLNPWSRASGMLVDGDDDDDRQPVVEHRSSAAFRPVASTSQVPPPQSADNDSIPADEAPVVVGSVVEEAPTASSSSAFTQKRLKGGLQTSSQLKEENARRRAAAEAEREIAKAAKAQAEASGGGEDTVYRDASGKRINTKEAKAELARQKRKEMEKEMQKMEWGKGLVQREEKEKKKQELEDMANKSFARFADDEEINDELKERDRWNDPAARFLSGNKEDKSKKKGPSRPKYNGPPPPPNRFNILPGYRWDGVDRSNGFERELVQAANKRKVNDAAARVYSTEDM